MRVTMRHEVAAMVGFEPQALVSAVYYIGTSIGTAAVAGLWPGRSLLPLRLLACVIGLTILAGLPSAWSGSGAVSVKYLPIALFGDGGAGSSTQLAGVMVLTFLLTFHIAYVRRRYWNEPESYPLPGFFLLGKSIPRPPDAVPIVVSDSIERHVLDRYKVELDIRDRITLTAGALVAALGVLSGAYMFFWRSWIDKSTEPSEPAKLLLIGGSLCILLCADFLLRVFHSSAYVYAADPLELFESAAQLPRDRPQKGGTASQHRTSFLLAALLKSYARSIYVNTWLNQYRLQLRDRAIFMMTLALALFPFLIVAEVLNSGVSELAYRLGQLVQLLSVR